MLMRGNFSERVCLKPADKNLKIYSSFLRSLDAWILRTAYRKGETLASFVQLVAKVCCCVRRDHCGGVV